MLLSDRHLNTEGKTRGRAEVTGRRGRKSKQLLDDLKERIGYYELKHEALDRCLPLEEAVDLS
jgi:hypothetical protein